MPQGVSIVIPTGKPIVTTLDSLGSCPIPHQVITSTFNGVGKARHIGALKAKYPLLVMFDDDLTVSPLIWKTLLKLEDGEFMLTHVGEHLSTRIFAIHLKDYLRVGGFNSEIKFIFEDGEFAYRAQQAGLKLNVLPLELVMHIEHRSRAHVGPFSLNLHFWAEWAKMYVKYGKHFERNLFAPFEVRHDYKVAFQWFVVKTAFIIGYIFLSSVHRERN
jgi:GT2 family glycosyltransferase